VIKTLILLLLALTLAMMQMANLLDELRIFYILELLIDILQNQSRLPRLF
jgi:hypothetical protein